MCGAIITGATVWVYNRVNKQEPKVITDFRTTLRVYIKAIQKGDMDIEKISDLVQSIERVKKFKDSGKLVVQLTTEELEILVNRIYKYTLQLANDNKVKIAEDEFANKEYLDSIIKLQVYLRVQRQIFEPAAKLHI